MSSKVICLGMRLQRTIGNEPAFVLRTTARQLRSALSSERKLVRPSGFEPPAFGSGGQRSIQLSYGRTELTRLQSIGISIGVQPRKNACRMILAGTL
jgi:hypothetical protein